MAKHDLSHLNTEQLGFLWSHLKLGLKHLKDQMPLPEFRRLLAHASFEPQQKKKLLTNVKEQLSQGILAANSIIVTLMGIWISLSSDLKLNKESLIVEVCSLSLVIGGLFGMTNLIRLKRESHQALEEQRLQYLQLKVLHMINIRLSLKGQVLLAKILNKFHAFSCVTKTAVSTSLKGQRLQIQHLLEPFSYLLKASLQQLPGGSFYQIDRLSLLRLWAQNQYKMKKRSEIATVKDPFFGWLRDYPQSIHDTLKPQSWYLKDFIGLASGIITTALGAFGSSFVWFNAFLTLAHWMRITSATAPSINPLFSYSELALALIFTFYFAFFYWYAQKKSYQRQQEVEDDRIRVCQQEARWLKRMSYIRELSQLYRQVMHLGRHLKRLRIKQKMKGIKSV